MAEIAEEEGLSVALVEKDAVNQVFRTFGEYDTASGQMTLYLASSSSGPGPTDFQRRTARELVMAHEFYHFLECTRLGMTSELYKIPLWRLGKWVLRSSGIRALSRLEPMDFARTCFEASGVSAL